MTINTSEEFSNFLDSEIVWRKKELALLKSMVSLYNSKPQQDAVVRGAIALLYAHWEGFIKNSACGYIGYLSLRRLSYKYLTSNFIAIRLKPLLGDVTSFNKYSKRKEIVDFIQLGLSEYCVLPADVINTQSNLSSGVFKEIVTMLGLDYSPYETKEKLIDEKLVHNRNNIAHGRYLTMQMQDYFELETEILLLMDVFKDQISNAAALKSYIKSAT
jgi:MAE_28990/MAE_18760-like HEPN